METHHNGRISSSSRKRTVKRFTVSTFLAQLLYGKTLLVRVPFCCRHLVMKGKWLPNRVANKMDVNGIRYHVV